MWCLTSEVFVSQAIFLQTNRRHTIGPLAQPDCTGFSILNSSLIFVVASLTIGALSGGVVYKPMGVCLKVSSETRV